MEWPEDGRYQELAVGALAGVDLANIGLLDGFLHPTELRFADGRGPVRIRQLEPAIVYTLDRYFIEGSCPYLFVRTDGGVRFLREIFSGPPGTTSLDDVVAPPGARELILAELDHEWTRIDEVTVNGSPVLSEVRLFRGDAIRIQVAEGDRVAFRGAYHVRGNEWRVPLAATRRQRIERAASRIETTGRNGGAPLI